MPRTSEGETQMNGITASPRHASVTRVITRRGQRSRMVSRSMSGRDFTAGSIDQQESRRARMGSLPNAANAAAP